MRLTSLAAAALVAAAACATSAPAPPSIAPPDLPPEGAMAFPVTIDDARTRLEGYPFVCTDRATALGVAVRCASDDRDNPSEAYTVVDLVASDGSFVTLVQATVDQSQADAPAPARFEGFYADTVVRLVVDPPPAIVDRWLHDHVATPGTTRVGMLVLDMSVGSARSTLRLWQEP